MQREGGEMKGRTPLSTLNTRCTQAMSKATASWGGEHCAYNTRGAQRKRVFNALSMRKEAYANRMGHGRK